MKINEARTVKTGAAAKKNAKVRIGSDFSSILEGASSASEVSSVPEVAGGTSINMIDSLIAVQQMEVECGDLEQSLGHGREILDFLEDIKGGMLGEGISLNKLEKLKSSIHKERGWVMDDKLSSIMDDIETRAKVEIAKLEIDQIRNRE